MKLRDVEPSGEGQGIGCGPAGCQVVTTKTYPITPEARNFRRARVDAGMSLRDAACALELSAVDVSAVERGSKVPEDWSAFWKKAGLLGYHEEKPYG